MEERSNEDKFNEDKFNADGDEFSCTLCYSQEPGQHRYRACLASMPQLCAPANWQIGKVIYTTRHDIGASVTRSSAELTTTGQGVKYYIEMYSNDLQESETIEGEFSFADLFYLCDSCEDSAQFFWYWDDAYSSDTVLNLFRVRCTTVYAQLQQGAESNEQLKSL